MTSIDWAEELEATCLAILMDRYSRTELQWMAYNRLYRLAVERNDVERIAIYLAGREALAALISGRKPAKTGGADQ